MNRIRYMAIVDQEPDKIAAYYAAQFQMRELGRTPAGGIALTDGYFNLSILTPDAESDGLGGLHHIGIATDDVSEIKECIAQFDSTLALQPEPDDICHGEFRIPDPNGYPVSVSGSGFGVPMGKRTLPYIAHVAFSIPNTERLVTFYRDIFGFREVKTSLQRRAEGRANRFMGDGGTNLTIHPDQSHQDHPTEPKVGINHFGFLCRDSMAVLERLGYVADEVRRPQTPPRPFAEYRVADPAGNAVDVSQRGYEVDVGLWARP